MMVGTTNLRLLENKNIFFFIQRIIMIWNSQPEKVMKADSIYNIYNNIESIIGNVHAFG